MFTITGSPQFPDGSKHRGVVSFTPHPALFVPASSRPTLGTVEVPLATDGSFSVDLEWKAGLQYTYRWGGRRGVWDEFTFDVPADGSTQDISELTPLPTPAALGPAFTKGDKGDPGDTGPAGPSLPQAGGMMATSVQGLYSRTKPVGNGTPAPTPSGFYALAKDPSVAGRVWMLSLDYSVLVFTDNGGASISAPAGITPAFTGAIHQLLFTAGHAWLVTGPNTDRQGQVWRSPLPAANGTGFSWTKVFDLASPPAAVTPVGVNSFFRPQCLAVAPNGGSWHVWLLEYGTTVTGGPSLYYSPDAGATWTKPKTWGSAGTGTAKHGHAVHAIGGLAVVMLGDASTTGGPTWTDIGLWRCSNAAGTGTWTQISIYGEAKGGNTLYGINFQPITVNGKAMLAIEYDGALNLGPLLFPDSGASAQQWPLLRTFQLPAAYFGTMRCLTLTSEGNLMWVQTTENGAFGPSDTVWISAPPFTSAVLLDSFASSTMFLGDPIEDGDYVWLGWYRCRKEKFTGQ